MSLKLNELADVMNISKEDAEYEMAAEAIPFYKESALSNTESVISGVMTPDEAWDKMEARRKELLLPESSTKELLTGIVMQALGRPLQKTGKFAKVNNEVAAYENLLEALNAKDALIKILAKSGWNEFENFDEVFCDPWNKESACGHLRSDERIKIFGIFMTRSLRNSDDGTISDEAYNRIKEVQGLLAISDEQAEVNLRAAFGPELKKACATACEEITQDYTPELAKKMANNIEEVMNKFKLSESFLRELGGSFYNKAVENVSAKAI